MCNYDNLSGGVDYISGPYNVVFGKGTSSASFNIIIINDMILESDETFSLTIDVISLPSDVIHGNPHTAIVTIVDDECK